MLNQLTKYLVQYRQVSIPSVGTIVLVQQSPQLDVVDKLIQPPAFRTEINGDDAVPEHQLNFLAAQLQQDKHHIERSLAEIGSHLKLKMQGNGFHWSGIGLLRHNTEAQIFSLPGLEPVPAEKVLRSDAEHKVLVGDQQMTSSQIAGLREDGSVEKKKRSVFVIIGWILLVLAILFIVFVLYQGKFRVGSTGSKLAPTSWQHPPKADCWPALS